MPDPKITIAVPKDFVASMNKFMAQVQKLQVQAQSAQATIIPPMPKAITALSRFLDGMKRVALALAKMTKNFERIVARMTYALGNFGRIFMRGLTSALPMFLRSIGMSAMGVLGPVGWIVGGGIFVVGAGISIGISAAQMAGRFISWMWDKMVGLGDSILQDWIEASGVMSTVGGVRALRLTFGDLPLGSDALHNAITARMDATSKARRALQLLGVRRRIDSANVIVEATIEAARFMRAQSPDISLAMAEAAGLTSIFPPEFLIAISQMTDEELRQKKDLFLQNRSALELTPKAIEGWKNFALQVEAAGKQIQKVIGEKLADAGFVKAFTDLNKGVIKFFKEVMELPSINLLVDTIIKYLKAFTDWLASDAPYKAMKDFKKVVLNIVKAIDDIRKQIQALLKVIGVSDAKADVLRLEEIQVSPDGTVYRADGRTLGPSGPRLTRGGGRPSGPGEQPGGGGKTGEPLPPGGGEGPPGTMYDPITSTSVGGGVGGYSASRGPGGHQGVDLMAPQGSPVYATKDGTIVRFGKDAFGQPTVTVRHADGTYSRYLHMRDRYGKIGDTVRGGQQIGTSGTANGVAHLHYEYWYGQPGARGSRVLNPMREFGWTRQRGGGSQGGRPADRKSVV